MRGPCVRARAAEECVEWPFLGNLASTFPSWKVLLVGQKQRPALATVLHLAHDLAIV
jgi:hypothetical protein